MIQHTANLRAAFGGFKFLPKWVAVCSNNSSFAELTLCDNYVQYRNFLTIKRLDYSNIAQIDVFFTWKTNNLQITPKSGIMTFTGNFYDIEQLRTFLQLFKQHGCRLTKKAEAELNKLK